MSENQADESAYQDPSYYGTLDGSLADAEGDFTGTDLEQRSPLREQVTLCSFKYYSPRTVFSPLQMFQK